MTRKTYNERRVRHPLIGITSLGLVAATAVLLTVPPAAAQESQQQRTGADLLIEEITVTARKREEGIYETPMSISAFTEASMRLQGIDRMMDIGRFVPNLNITRFGVGNTSHATIFIRGIGLQDHIITTDPGVGIYLDGVYLGRQMGANLDLKNIERVEVLRGPQGTLYGRNSIGGAVNIITKRPSAEEEFQYELQAGSRGRAGANFYASHPINDNLAISASGAFTRRNGVGDALNVVEAKKDVGEIFTASFHAALDWRPRDDLSFLVSVDGIQGDNGQSPSTAELFPASACGPGDCFFADPANVGGLEPPNNETLTPDDIAPDPYDTNTAEAGLLSQNNTGYGIHLVVDWNISDTLDGKLLAGYRESDYKGGLDDETALQDFQSFPEKGDAEQFSLEGQLNGTYDNWDFVGGLYFFTESGNTHSEPNTFITGPQFFDVNQDTDSLAGYFHAGFKATDAIRLAFGVRYTKDEKDADALFNNFPWFLPPPDGNNTQRVFRSDDWSEFTWNASLTYSFNDNLSMYALTAAGYQNGGYPARAFGGPQFFTAFNPTTAQNYEVGLKGLVTDNWQVALSVFFTEYDDLALQFSEPFIGGFTTVTSNAGETESKGVELESTLRFTEEWTLQTNIGFNDAEITKVDPGTIGIALGDVPTLTPEWTALVGLQYDRELNTGNHMTFRVDYSYRDEMFGQSVNNAFNRLDSRDIVNFMLSYDNLAGDWTISLYGDNIFDEEYDMARLDQAFGGFTEIILSNDRSEFGIKFSKRVR